MWRTRFGQRFECNSESCREATRPAILTHHGGIGLTKHVGKRKQPHIGVVQLVGFAATTVGHGEHGQKANRAGTFGGTTDTMQDYWSEALVWHRTIDRVQDNLYFSTQENSDFD